MKNFEEMALRLKQQLRVVEDRNAAEALGLTADAWVKRKKRGSFPEKELRALVQMRPELGIDVEYVLTGQQPVDAKAAWLRLKSELVIHEDAAVIEWLGMTPATVNAYTMRGMFPKQQFLAACETRPELGIDTNYVFTGQRLHDSVAESIRGLPERVREVRGTLSEVEFAAAWGIGTEQLAQIESGQRPPSVDLLKRLVLMYPDDASYLMTGVRPVVSGPLTAREAVLISNYRACSDEGRESLLTQAAFLAQYNADHAPVSSKIKQA